MFVVCCGPVALDDGRDLYLCILGEGNVCKFVLIATLCKTLARLCNFYKRKSNMLSRRSLSHVLIVCRHISSRY